MLTSGYTTIVPRLFEPKFEGYDGDGIPPNCERDAMAAYMKKINWQGKYSTSMSRSIRY